MNAPLPDDPALLQPGPPAARVRRRLLLGVLALALVATLAGLRWWLSRPPALLPPLPAEMKDPDIRRVVEQARQEVLQHPTAANWGNLGNVLLANLFDAEADPCYQEAHRLDPKDARWPYFRGFIALKRRPDEATPFLREAVASNTWSEYQFAMRIKLVEALLDRNELDEAEQILLKEKPSAKNAARVEMNLGLLAMARGQWQRAQAHFSRVRTSPYVRKRAASQLAALARMRNDLVEAERYQNEFTRLEGDLAWPDPVLEDILKLGVGRYARHTKIESLEKDHQYAQAAELYLRLLESEPTVQNYLGAGFNLARLKDYQKALPLLRKAVQLDASSARAHFVLAITLFRRAEEQQQRAPGSRENDADFQEVVQEAALATSLKADYPMAYLIWGLALKYLGKEEAAVDPLRRGISCGSELVELHLSLAEVYLDLRKDAEAAQQLDDASRLDANDARLAVLRQRLQSNKTKQK